MYFYTKSLYYYIAILTNIGISLNYPEVRF